MIVHDKDQRAILKHTSSERIVDRNNTAVRNSFPRLDRPYGFLIRQAIALKSAQNIKVAIFVRLGFVHPARESKHRRIFLMSEV